MKTAIVIIASVLFSAIPNVTLLDSGRKSFHIKAKKTLSELDLLLEEVCHINHNLVRAVIEKESGKNHKAISHKGAIGLMQLMPATAKELNVDPYDKRDNIKGGCEYLGKQLKKFDGNVKLALAAYNAGRKNVLKFGGIPPFKETRQYVKNICENYNCEIKYDS